MTVPRISSVELKRRMDDAHPPHVVDVRLKYPYEHSTIMIPGAVRTGPGVVDLSQLSPGQEIVLYDSDPGEIVAERAAGVAIAAGFRAVVLEGGIAGWVTAKFSTQSKAAPHLAVPVCSVAHE